MIILKENLKKYSIILVLVNIMFFSLTGCSSEDKTNLNSKLSSEIEYVDRNLISMLNKVNNIQFPNYVVTAEKIEERDSSKSEGQGASNQDNSSKSQSGESGGEQSRR